MDKIIRIFLMLPDESAQGVHLDSGCYSICPRRKEVADKEDRYRDHEAQFSGNKGFRYALENLIKPYMNTVTLSLIDMFPDLGLCLDTGHAEILSTWKDFCAADILPRIVALHLNDNDGRSDDHLIPGEGVINFNTCIARLVRGGYGGIWGIECKQGYGNYDGDAMDIAQKAFSFLMNVFSKQEVRTSSLT